jgi:hypothetical protein
MRRFGVAVAFALLVVTGGGRAASPGEPERVLVGYGEGGSASALALERRLGLSPVARITQLRISSPM